MYCMFYRSLQLIKKISNSFLDSNIREFIWPIKYFELPKFFLMAILMFLILLNQNLIRVLKDSFIMTLVGPEVISFIKLWCEMPAGILFVILYTKLCNIVTTEQVFRRVIVFFISFFALFAFVFYPYQSFFHPSSNIVEDYVLFTPRFKWFIVLWGKWSFVLFYVMGELWPIIVFTLLFWQLANKTTKTDEAKRFYSFFNLFGQSNLLISGVVICYFVQNNHFLYGFYCHLQDPTEITLKSVTSVIILTGVIILGIHYVIEKKVLYTEGKTNHTGDKSELLKLSLKESSKVILKSKYLWLICILIISYNTTINLIEGLWMSKVKSLYPTAQEFMLYQGKVLFWTGVFTLFCTFTGSILIRKCGWFFAAIITPVITMIAGTLFFAFVINEEKITTLLGILPQFTSLMVIVFIGGVQNVLSKGAKYSLFDATKEISYIPLDNEMKTKGKAAVDIIGTKIGKSAGSLIQFLLFTLIPHAKYEDITGILATIFGMIILVWILAVKALSVHYELLLNKVH